MILRNLKVILFSIAIFPLLTSCANEVLYTLNENGYSLQLYANNDVGGQTPTHGEITGDWKSLSDSTMEVHIMPFTSTIEAVVSEEQLILKVKDGGKELRIEKKGE